MPFGSVGGAFFSFFCGNCRFMRFALQYRIQANPLPSGHHDWLPALLNGASTYADNARKPSQGALESGVGGSAGSLRELARWQRGAGWRTRSDRRGTFFEFVCINGNHAGLQRATGINR